MNNQPRHLISPLVFTLLTACGPSPTPQPPTGRPVLDASAPTAKPLPRLLTLPAGTVTTPERFSFLQFGDVRRYRSECDRHRPSDKHCDVRVTPGKATLTKDCELMKLAPKKVLREVAERITKLPGQVGRRDAFALFNGDLVYRGSCAGDWAWARKHFLSIAPLQRVFPLLGNHETWRKKGEPPPLPFYFRAFDKLRARDGAKVIRPHYYAFRVGRSLFLNLCTGGYTGRTTADFLHSDRTWLCTEASFAVQMKWMRRALAWGVSQGVKHVFVQYHKPSFSCSRHPGLDDHNDPLTVLRPFKKKHPGLTVLAMSGHNHTTAVYHTGGILVLVAGGAGAPQHLAWGSKACHRNKQHQPPELFWKNAPRTSRYNFFQIVVNGDKVSIQERCLARKAGGWRFEHGSTVTLAGKVRPVPGACNLAPPAK